MYMRNFSFIILQVEVSSLTAESQSYQQQVSKLLLSSQCPSMLRGRVEFSADNVGLLVHVYAEVWYFKFGK